MSAQCRAEKLSDKCAYKDCSNRRVSGGRRLYRFPLLKDTRLSLWIRNSGNTNLEKWSPSTIRGAGLCANHFTEESFTSSTKTRLKRDAVPIHFRDNVSMEKSAIICGQRNVEVQQAPHNEGGYITEQMEHIRKNATPTSSSHILTSKNEGMDEELFERSLLQSYQHPRLCFDTPAEEEDIMEWAHLEPSICERTRTFKPKSTQTEENKSDLYTIINSLKSENIRLRRLVKCLKQRLQRNTRMSENPKSPK